MVKTLDALALAACDIPTRVQRIAALWCRAFNDRFPESASEMAIWVKQEFGPVLDPEFRDQLPKLLLEETRRQIRIRKRRKKNNNGQDPLTHPGGSNARLGALLNSRLGPARAWVSQQKILRYSHDSESYYIDGAVYSGLVAGLIPVALRTRRIVNPSLLIYRHGFREPHTRWVPGHITTVANAFIWLIPPEVGEFLQLPESRVEHDGEAESVRLITQFGTKTIPWRELSPQ